MNIIDQKFALEKLNSGLPIVFQTDTLPAIGCLPKFSEMIYKIKKRDIKKPLILMGAENFKFDDFVHESALDDFKYIASCYWPGPLTIVLPLINEFPKEINNGSGFLGVRVPNHSFTQKVIESLGKPITGTSANISNVAPTKDLNEIKDTFSKKVSIIAEVDCGPENLSSTVIKIDNNKSGIDILREGPVSLEKIKKVINL